MVSRESQWIQLDPNAKQGAEPTIDASYLELDPETWLVRTTFNLPGFWLHPAEDGAVHPSAISMYSALETGAPDVMRGVYRIALPGGATLTEEPLQIDSHAIKLAGTYKILPVPFPYFDPDPPTYVRGEHYSRNDFYPETLCDMSRSGTVDGMRNAALSVMPVQFNPVSGEMIAHRRLDITAKISGKIRRYEPEQVDWYSPLVKRMPGIGTIYSFSNGKPVPRVSLPQTGPERFINSGGDDKEQVR